ncbi:T9SS type A sorting domain-containing protein [Moheibacter stercoris]|uniref:Ribosomal protein S11 n=1 Tax=Moheibacter stercoris TaxID=1628251 RepID=A0ABV2LZ80_9FLAO
MRKHLFSRHKLILFMSVIFSSMLLANPMNSWEKIKTNQWLDSQLNVGLNIFSGWNSNQFFGTFDEGCTITTFPFNETFEADSASRICWTNEYVVGTSNWIYRAGSSGSGTGAHRTSHGGVLNASFSQSSQTANQTRLVSPMFDFTDRVESKLSFWYVNPTWGSDQSQLRVFYKTSADGAWTLIPGAEYISNVTAWTQVTLNLPESDDASEYYIAFEGINDYSYGIGVDDVKVESTQFAEGCLNDYYGMYPELVYFPNCIGHYEPITADAWGAEYALVNLIGGQTYYFKSSIETNIVTIANFAGNTVLKAGVGQVEFTPTATGNYRFLAHDDESCDDSSIQRMKLVKCGTITPISAPNYPCVKGDGIIGEVQDGFGINAEYRVADDFVVDEGFNLTVRQMTFDVLSSTAITQGTFNIRASENGSPGEILHTITLSAESSVLHNAGYGLKGYHVTFNLTTPIVLNSGTYWIEPEFLNTNSSTVYWQVNENGTTGGYVQFSEDFGDTWGEDFSVQSQAVFFIAGECGCLATDVPYLQDFTSAVVPGMPECTTVVNAGTGNNWATVNYTTTTNGFSGKVLRYSWNTNNAANSWFFTQGLNLEEGVTYQISYDYGAAGFSESMKVMFGNSNTPSGMTNLIADYPSFSHGKTSDTKTFTPSATGVYYVGFNAYSARDMFYLHLDNILIDVVPEEPVEGCLSTPNGAWPEFAQTPVCNGVPNLITDEGYFGEYSIINVVAGTEYTFSTDIETAYITIANSNATEILATGTGSLVWTAETTGTVRFITHENEDCLSSENLVSRMVACGEFVPYDPCAPEHDGLGNNGVGMVHSATAHYVVANDFNVLANTQFEINSVTARVVTQGGLPTTFEAMFFEGETGVGAQIGEAILGITPTSITPAGEFGNTGFTTYEVVLTFDEPLVFEATETEDKKYWIGLSGTPSTTNNNIFWVSYVYNLEDTLPTWQSANGGSTWSLYVSNGRNYEGIMSIDGTCSELEQPQEGCLEAEYGAYPEEAFTPACIGIPESITEGDIGWFGEYSIVNVTEGTEYVFSTDVATAFITIADGAGEIVFTTGTGSVTWTATLTGAIRYYTHENEDCLASEEWVDRMVTCGEIVPPPANDDCENAITVACGDSVTGSTVTATNSGGNSAGDVFYTFTGTGVAQNVTLSLCDSDFDTVLRVFTDCTLATEIAFNDDECGTRSELTFESDGTSTYYIMVEGWSITTGNYVLDVTCEDLDEEEPTEGCLEAENGAYPSTAYTPSCYGIPESITGGDWGWFGEYSLVNVTAGTEYIFSTDVATAFITISDEDGLVAYTTGTGTVTWTATATETIRYYTHENEDCLGSQNWVDRMVQCGEIVPPPPYDPCAPIHTGIATNGVGFVNNGADNYMAANDFNVLANAQFEVEKFTINVVTLGGAPTTFDMMFFEGDTAVGAQFGETLTSITPSSITENGTFGSTGYPVYSVEFTLPNTVIFPATATADKKYWVGISGQPTAAGNPVYWVSSDYVYTDTLPTYQSANGGATFDLFVSSTGATVEGDMIIDGECATLGLSDMSGAKFAYYPNPVKDVLNITTAKGIEKVEVFNLAGQSVMANGKVLNGQVNVSALTSGSYVFRVTLEGGHVETFKVIKK